MAAPPLLSSPGFLELEEAGEGTQDGEAGEEEIGGTWLYQREPEPYIGGPRSLVPIHCIQLLVVTLSLSSMFFHGLVLSH